MPPRQTDPQDSVVTHQHKTVRKQFVDLRRSAGHPEDEESFVIRHGGETLLDLRPADFQQFIACLRKAAADAGMSV